MVTSTAGRDTPTEGGKDLGGGNQRSTDDVRHGCRISFSLGPLRHRHPEPQAFAGTRFHVPLAESKGDAVVPANHRVRGVDGRANVALTLGADHPSNIMFSVMWLLDADRPKLRSALSCPHRHHFRRRPKYAAGPRSTLRPRQSSAPKRFA